MGKANSGLVIENENLFRALFCAPIAILFGALTLSLLVSSDIVLFKVIFVLLTLYFSLSALAHAAYYTNERLEGTAEAIIENKNLSKLLYCVPLTLLFVAIAVNSVSFSTHMVFNVVFVLMAIFFTLSTLAYAAFYTNDCYAIKSGDAA